jgi:hypothetical protein
MVIPGFDAEKKNSDLARKESQMKYSMAGK